MIDPKKTMDQFDALDARYTRARASNAELLAAAKLVIDEIEGSLNTLKAAIAAAEAHR